MTAPRRTPRFLLVGLLLAPAGPMALLAMVFGTAAVVIVDLSCSTTQAMTVSSRTWTRTIAIERWAHVTRSGWCDEVPPGATIRDRTRTTAAGRVPHPLRRDHHHHSTSHRTTTRAWCTYELDDWAEEAPAVASGDADPRTWPDAPPPDACPDEPELGCVRGGERTETLSLGLTPAEPPDPADADASAGASASASAGITCPVSEPAWSAHLVGDPVGVQFSLVFHRPRCARIE